jgi:hypothetical protein
MIHTVRSRLQEKAWAGRRQQAWRKSICGALQFQARGQFS